MVPYGQGQKAGLARTVPPGAQQRLRQVLLPSLPPPAAGAEDVSGDVSAEFTYSVSWKESATPFEKRMDKYRRYQFLKQHLEVRRRRSGAARGGGVFLYGDRELLLPGVVLELWLGAGAAPGLACGRRAAAGGREGGGRQSLGAGGAQGRHGRG